MSTNDGHELSRQQIPFDPDWTIAPAATLGEWMSERGWDARKLGTQMALVMVPVEGGGLSWQTYEQAVLIVLAKQPMLSWFPHMMAVVSGTSQLFWRNLEDNYRDGLRRGLEDVTFGGE